MSAVNNLQRNNPKVRSISIELHHEELDADLAQALQQNAFIQEVILHVGSSFEDWRLLRQVIETKDLAAVTVFPSPGAPPPADALVLPFLEAAHANTTVDKIRLGRFSFVPGSEVFNYVCATEFGEKMLAIYQCDMVDPIQREQGATALAASNIKRLQIWDCDAAFTYALLRKLGKHATNLKELELAHNIDRVARCDEMVQFLQDTKTIQRFHLNWRIGWGTTIAALGQRLLSAIQQNFSLRSVTLLFQGWPLFCQATDQAQRLEFYGNRNERLAEWIEKPDVVRQELWPEALSMAQQAGPDALFKSLRSVLGSKNYVKVGSSTSGKKRKGAEL